MLVMIPPVGCAQVFVFLIITHLTVFGKPAGVFSCGFRSYYQQAEKGVTVMETCAGFWVGMGAGVMTGAALGMMMPHSRQSMKTQVGKSIHKLGVAVDNAVDNVVSELR